MAAPSVRLMCCHLVYLAARARRNIIRLAPPLVISQEQLHEATGIIKKVFSSL